MDAFDSPVINYSGTVRFTSSDPAAVLPADYTFVTSPVSENGVHTFSGVTFNTVGPRAFTITDLATGISTTKQVFVGNLNPNNLVSLSVNSQPAFFRNEALTFNVVVSGTGASPTGVVRFYEGIQEIGMGMLTPSTAGSASTNFTTRSFRVGDHKVIAVYEGDANYGANFSTEATKARSPAPRCVNDRCPGMH